MDAVQQAKQAKQQLKKKYPVSGIMRAHLVAQGAGRALIRSRFKMLFAIKIRTDLSYTNLLNFLLIIT